MSNILVTLCTIKIETVEDMENVDGMHENYRITLKIKIFFV